MTRGLLGALLAPILASPALAHATDQSPTGNLEKLAAFHSTGTAEPEADPAEGRKADAIRRNLAKVKLPPGFKIDLYAIVPDARHMAVGPNAGVVFVGTRKNKVYAVTDRDKDRVADEVKVFAPAHRVQGPERRLLLPGRRPLRRRAEPGAGSSRRPSSSTRARTSPAFEVVKQGELIPASEESYNHTARVCRIGPDNKLYIALGQPFNVPPKEKLDLYKQAGIGGIIRMDRTARTARSTPRACATPSAWTSIPTTRRSGSPTTRSTAWATTCRRASSTAPPRPARISASPGTAAAHVRTTEYKDDGAADGRGVPAGRAGAARGRSRHDLLHWQDVPGRSTGAASSSAQHGSWNRTQPIGARIMFMPVKPDGTADKPEAFAEGWLTERRRVSRPARGRGGAPRRLAARLRRHRGRDLPHLLRGP